MDHTPTTPTRRTGLMATAAAVVVGVGAAAFITAGAASSAPGERTGPPQPRTGSHAASGVAAAAANPNNNSTLCDGGTHHRTLVRTNDNPIYWTSGTQAVAQQVTTKSSQGWETLVITWSGETWTSAALAYLQADIRVDGSFIEPYDTINPNAIKSGESYADTSFTRCVKVKPGTHKVEAVFTPVGSGSMWIDDYTLRIDQYN